MGSCNEMTFQFVGMADDLFAQVQAAIHGNGTLNGDSEQGTFSVLLGSIKGSYRVDGNTLRVTVSSRPGPVSCEKIQNEIAGRLAVLLKK